jgi:hypothetical protein
MPIRRVSLALVTCLAVLFAGGYADAGHQESYVVACTVGTALASPATSTVSCATRIVQGVGPADVTTGRVIVHGVGVVGGLVRIERAVTTGPFTTAASAPCGSVLLTCEAATTYTGENTNTFPTRMRALCSWSGVLAVNATVTCEMIVRLGA